MDIEEEVVLGFDFDVYTGLFFDALFVDFILYDGFYLIVFGFLG